MSSSIILLVSAIDAILELAILVMSDKSSENLDIASLGNPLDFNTSFSYFFQSLSDTLSLDCLVSSDISLRIKGSTADLYDPTRKILKSILTLSIKSLK